ncbi:MAG TPA: extracellular solute-binding protein [Candidatus Limivivens intestinipullorum]|uniref:Maltodextrin-binding protein n=1 Tax=Candidatus Limivivens intestinipullorum TaxID=2840858 RepID=A0A9D1EWC4_9FIRM|nr:extracellular solute-binding protein [Candidatus Limivivens intestinipullorum]
MKNRKTALLLCAAMTIGILSGYSETVQAEEPAEISIWHDGDEAIMQVIQEQVNEELSGDSITVNFEKKSGLTDQLKLYGNDAANGPDMYLYAHDSLGTFAEMGMLSPITEVVSEDVYQDMLPMTLEAGQYKGEQYLLPVYYETLLFMYNKDLWEGGIPDTTEGLYEYMTAHTDTEAGTYALVNQHSTAYNVAPVINGFGGYIIDENAAPGLNEEKTKEAIAYNKKFAELEADGDYNTITTLFNEGKAAAIIGGPWLISGIREAGINLGIKSLAEFELPNGSTLMPYSGVQGIGVMKHAAEEKKDALEKVFTALCDPAVGIALAEQSNCAPANQISYEDETVAGNEMIAAMKSTAEVAVPMPNIPEMSVMWGPAESLLAAVNKSGEDLDSAADQYQKAAETAIADMQ